MIHYRVKGLTEPTIVLDTFVSGLGMVECVSGGLMRLTYYAEMVDPYTGDNTRPIALRMVRPVRYLAEDTKRVQEAIAPQLVPI
ncbi:hypothetical protein [Pseudohoeflea coraliihabitans]|uniref:Uncharacterized protein n=1 Tax=Pseudohoeflea coraliihabitans TaxID=2860393 RepID=A0ABS6WI92_9HYPH|nr:hypothetical protein [Pseudohoeflea sp. DP4N28-3]MBW3095664.1 hypothetical protein [Pseudohoeflea sp. DP4N28-3]